MRNLLAVHTPPKRIRRELYATWGVDLDLFSPSGARSVEIHHPHTILFVGRLVEQKGVRELLRAFSLVLEQEADAALVFIGDGPLGGEIRRFMRDHCTDDRIRLLGIIPNSELPPYFRAAEITVVPSLTQPVWSEQVGMVAIQSMACGTPVITTNSGSIPEFVQDGITGLLVPERNPEAMAGAILELLRDDRLRRKLATSGRAYAEKRYDAASNVAKVQDILLQLLARTRPSAFACPNRANQSGPGPESEDSRST
ncbi:MAG TPA: glycosyltransferase family 4 protein [bacterium]|nr:glycosyltransferase family 4 protein [bacterium]